MWAAHTGQGCRGATFFHEHRRECHVQRAFAQEQGLGIGEGFRGHIVEVASEFEDGVIFGAIFVNRDIFRSRGRGFDQKNADTVSFFEIFCSHAVTDF